MKETNSNVRKTSRWAVVPVLIMVIGVALFLLTPLFIRYLHFDTDILGVLVFLIGIVVYVAGLIVRVVRKKA